MSIEEYEALLAESGPKKLQAKALLAFGDDKSVFEASVVLHDVVRIERRALEALPSPSATTRLLFLIERCACLLDGLDPAQALANWFALRLEAENVPKDTRDAMCERIEPRMVETEREFGTLLRKTPLLMSTWTASSVKQQERRTLRKALRRLLERYPGMATFWFSLSHLEEYQDDLPGAWSSAEKASRLEPENAVYTAARYWMAPQFLPAEQVLSYYEGAEQLRDEVRLLFVLGTIEAFTKGVAPPRALDRAEQLLAVPPRDTENESLLVSFAGARLMLTLVREGRALTEETLRQANLGNVVDLWAAPGARSLPRALADATLQGMLQQAA
jgi:hypothetical protein